MEFLSKKEQESLDNLKKHKILLEKRSKDIQQIIKGKNKLTNQNKKEIQKITLNNPDSITDTRLFIEQNIELFKKKINDKVKELNEEIKAEKESRISPEQKMVEKIKPIIKSHESFLTNLSTLFTQVKGKEDIDKLLQMSVILDKIVSKNKNGYEIMLSQYNKNNKFTIGEFNDKIKKFYEEDSTNRSSKWNKGTKYYRTWQKFTDEIKKENWDMQKLQTTFNNLLTELYTKYKIYTSNGKPPQISETVPPVTLHKSLDYNKLLNQINRLFLRIPKDSKNSTDDFMNILKIKIIIDEFMSRIGGSNFERIKYNSFSSKTDLNLKSKIPNFDSESSKLKSEYNNKSVEQLKQDINELLAGFYSKYFPENTNVPKIGNIQEANSTNAENPKNNLSTVKNPDQINNTPNNNLTTVKNPDQINNTPKKNSANYVTSTGGSRKKI